MYECDDIEALPGGERGSGQGVGARGANSGVDASYANDANDANDTDDAHDAMVAAATLCGCCLGVFSPSPGFFPAPFYLLFSPCGL